MLADIDRFCGQIAAAIHSSELQLYATLGLIVVAVTSYVSRRFMGRHAALSGPGRAERVFFRAHVIPALIAVAWTGKEKLIKELSGAWSSCGRIIDAQLHPGDVSVSPSINGLFAM